MATFTEHLWYFCSFHFNDNPPTPPHGFFFFFFCYPYCPKGKTGVRREVSFPGMSETTPQTHPVTPVGVPSEEDGTTVPPRKCHEAGAEEDGEVLRQPKCHLPVTRVSPWPPRPPHDTSAPRASLIWSPESSPDPLKPHRSFSAPPTLL